MKALEKLLLIYKNEQLKNIDVNINILIPTENGMSLTVSNKIVKGSVIVEDYKIFLEIPSMGYKNSVCLEYIDYDLLEVIDISKLPRKVIVFDIALPVPF